MSANAAAGDRAKRLFDDYLLRIRHHTSRIFAGLMIAQWLLGIGFALWISPKTWAGAVSQTHIHVYAAALLGGAISSLPVLLGYLRPTWPGTCHVIAAGQMLTSALLIHLTGGRIETHFHVFGSLAFLAFYRDRRVLLTATVVVVLDHGLRGIYWPQSVYGVLAVQPWRFLEHAGWVLFEDAVLVMSIAQSLKEMRTISDRQAQLESMNNKVEQLSVSVAHELRNPLSTVNNALYYINDSLKDSDLLQKDPALKEVVESAVDSVQSSIRIANDLLNLYKPVKLKLSAVDVGVFLSNIEKSAAIPANVKVVKNFLGSLPQIQMDAERMKQVLVNLMNNAAQAMPEGGVLSLSAEMDPGLNGSGPWLRIQVRDTGAGISDEHMREIFKPMFTTKIDGTGIGLAICRNFVESHGGDIHAESQLGKGTAFTIRIPAPTRADMI